MIFGESKRRNTCHPDRVELQADLFWAELHGPAIKAANSRNKAPLFAALARVYYDGSTQEGIHILDVLSKLEEWHSKIKTVG